MAALRHDIVITNTSKGARSIGVWFEPRENSSHHIQASFDFDVSEDLNHGVGLPGREDEIEHLEQKLKIARRKGREDKVKKIKAKLALLRGDPSAETEDTQVDQQVDMKSQEDISDATTCVRPRKNETSLVFSLAAKATQTGNQWTLSI